MAQMGNRKTSGPASKGRIGLAGALLLILAALIDQVFLQNDSSSTDVGSIAEAREAKFDYYVLALSWSPSHCVDNPDADQCERKRRFIMHGLWPQHERGFPTDCSNAFAKPSRKLLSRYADLTASAGLLAYQWRKHGACAGLSPEEYFAHSREAVERITTPPALDQAKRIAVVRPAIIETAFLQANPNLHRDGVTIKCRDNMFTEVRICLTKDLQPRKCGADVMRDCSAQRVKILLPE
jgi:ribonuclease T2